MSKNLIETASHTAWPTDNKVPLEVSLGFPGSSQLFEGVWEEGRVQQKEERTLLLPTEVE